MTRKPNRLKSEKDLLHYIVGRAHELSAALEISDSGTRNHATRIRRSVDVLIKCADLVSEIHALARVLSPEPPAEASYAALSVGQLQTLGYLNEVPARGTVVLPGLPPIGIHSAPSSIGHEIRIEGSASRPLQLEATGTSFGGSRWWFVCGGAPGVSCKRRVLKLYRRQGRDFFACRDCHRLTDDHGWRSARDRTITAVTLYPAGAIPDTHAGRRTKIA